MSSSLPAVPVSTTAASPARARTYADTNPRFTRSQVIPTPGAAGDPAGGASEPGGSAEPDDGLGDAPPDAAADRGLAPPLGLDAAGAQPAIPTTASATVPRPSSARKRRREKLIGALITDRWYETPPSGGFRRAGSGRS